MTMPKKILARVGLLLFCFALPVAADEGSVKKALQAKFPKARVENIAKTPYMGLYEVVMEGNFFYTDENANYLFAGSIIDSRTMKNLTEERMRQLFTVSFDSLPLEFAIKNVKGNGKRTLVVFADPNCPYCKRLEKELAKISDVTIYTFLYPILSANSSEKSKAVWCSADRAKAWDDLMLRDVVPASDKKCNTPVDAVLELGRSLNITGTPTMIFADGMMVPGAISAAQLEKQLDASAPKQTAQEKAK